MYADAFTQYTAGGTENKTANIGDYVNFHPYWRKVGRTMTGDNYDYSLKKQISLNLGKIKYFEGAWQDLNANLTALGKAWTYARDSASVDLSFTYRAPVGYSPTMSSINGITLASSTNNNLNHIIPNPGNTAYSTIWNQLTPRPTMNCYDDLWNAASSLTTGVPTPTPGPVVAQSTIAPLWIQSWYNTWISLNNAGAFNISSNGTGLGLGSGPINDYGKVHSDGGAYDVTPPSYTFNHWTHINGKVGFANANIPYGVNWIPAPITTANYPWGGIVMRNGIIYVNYFIANGGAVTRCKTDMRFQRGQEGLNYAYTTPYWHYQDTTGADADCFTYSFIIPKGYVSRYVSWNDNPYTQGPWPANQNRTCEGFYWRGEFIPTVAQRHDDILMTFKIQTQPSSRHDGIRAEK